MGDHGRSKQAGSVGPLVDYLKVRLGNVVHGRVVSPRSESEGGLSTPWGVVVLWYSEVPLRDHVEITGGAGRFGV